MIRTVSNPTQFAAQCRPAASTHRNYRCATTILAIVFATTVAASASDSAALPRASSFSRGRSPSGQSRMLMHADCRPITARDSGRSK